MGNAPSVDLMVMSPQGERFQVQVKGLRGRNPWFVPKKAERPENLFYFFAYVPPDAPSQIFVMNQEQLEALVRGEVAELERPAYLNWKQVANDEYRYHRDKLPK